MGLMASGAADAPDDDDADEPSLSLPPSSNNATFLVVAGGGGAGPRAAPGFPPFPPAPAFFMVQLVGWRGEVRVEREGEEEERRERPGELSFGGR